MNKSFIVVIALLFAIATQNARGGNLSLYSNAIDSGIHDNTQKESVFYLDSTSFVFRINYQIDGRVDENSKSRKTTRKYSVKRGQIFYYTLRTYASSYMIVAFDKNNRIISEASVAGNNDAFLRTDYYTVPQGVSYLAFSYSTDYKTAEYVEVKQVDSNKSLINSLNDEAKTTISVPNEDFVGFPNSFVKDGIIYVIYKRTASHNVFPGKNFFPVYKYSKDEGKTWSKEKRIKLPLSESRELYREYLPYVKNVNGNIHTVFNISVSNKKNGIIRRTAYAKIKVSRSRIRVKELQFFPNSKMDGSLVFCDSDQMAIDKASSLMCGGGFVIDDGIMYVPIYTPLGTSICTWDMSKPITSASFKKRVTIGSDVVNKFTEAAIVKINNRWLMALRNEHHKSPLYVSRDNFNTISYLNDLPYELNNPEFKVLNNGKAVLMARARDCGKHGYLAVINENGDRLVESFYEDEPMELSDCCSGTMEIVGDKLHIFYYASASGERNGIFHKIIDINQLDSYMIDY